MSHAENYTLAVAIGSKNLYGGLDELKANFEQLRTLSRVEGGDDQEWQGHRAK